jgi:hypothetical protein
MRATRYRNDGGWNAFEFKREESKSIIVSAIGQQG